jgi:hypothetical protein
VAILRKRGPAEHRLRPAGELRPPPGFDELVTVSTGPEGPVALWSSPADVPDLRGRRETPGGSFPEPRTAGHPRVALASYPGGSPSPGVVAVVSGLPVAHPLVQPLPGGEFLVAGARCAWRAEGPEENALVVSPDGAVRRTGTLGDGIEHLLADAAGEVWAGYFDEGIFGNLGWGGPGPEPLGSSGIVRWSARFEKLWEYTAVDDYWPADCYALNVDDRRAWACPYTDFPVVRIDGDDVSVRPTTGVAGPRGIVVAGDDVAVVGGYGDPGALRLGSLDDLGRLTAGALVMPDGRPLPASATLVCRGGVADLFVGARRFTFDLADAV